MIVLVCVYIKSTECECIHAFESVLPLCVFFFFFHLISENISHLCREMPLGHESGHMAPLVRIRHLSKSNCTVEKLNCTHMIMERQRTTKALDLKRFLWDRIILTIPVQVYLKKTTDYLAILAAL